MSEPATIGTYLPSFMSGPEIGSLAHARLVLESMQHKLADTLETYYKLDKRYEWLLANKDAHPDPMEREKMNQNCRSIGFEIATYKRDWGPQARAGVRFWEDEVKRLEKQEKEKSA